MPEGTARLLGGVGLQAGVLRRRRNHGALKPVTRTAAADAATGDVALRHRRRQRERPQHCQHQHRQHRLRHCQHRPPQRPVTAPVTVGITSSTSMPEGTARLLGGVGLQAGVLRRRRNHGALKPVTRTAAADAATGDVALPRQHRLP